MSRRRTGAARRAGLGPPTQVSIQFAGGVSVAPLDERRIIRLTREAAGRGHTIALRFVGRAEAHRLNREFRGADYVPNVLTFPYPDIASADVVICPPVVREQARAQGKTYADHLSHMVVHGALHAIGHTHEGRADAARMESIERDVLARFGVPDPY